MNIIDEFIKHYEKEYDFYGTSSKLVAQQLENALHTSGIRAIVTYRAKNPQRLKTKLIQRDKEHHYSALEDIYNDICDFSGVRVALYFPSDREFLFSSALPRRAFLFIEKGKQRYNQATKQRTSTMLISQ